jgi:hypothetical protein
MSLKILRQDPQNDVTVDHEICTVSDRTKCGIQLLRHKATLSLLKLTLNVNSFKRVSL